MTGLLLYNIFYKPSGGIVSVPVGYNITPIRFYHYISTSKFFDALDRYYYSSSLSRDDWATQCPISWSSRLAATANNYLQYIVYSLIRRPTFIVIAYVLYYCNDTKKKIKKNTKLKTKASSTKIESVPHIIYSISVPLTTVNEKKNCIPRSSFVLTVPLTTIILSTLCAFLYTGLEKSELTGHPKNIQVMIYV